MCKIKLSFNIHKANTGDLWWKKKIGDWKDEQMKQLPKRIGHEAVWAFSRKITKNDDMKSKMNVCVQYDQKEHQLHYGLENLVIYDRLHMSHNI